MILKTARGNPIIKVVASKNTVTVTKLPAKHAYGSRITRHGGVSGAITGGNGIGIVPCAFRNHV
jgi:hypothetical protein